MSPPIPVHTSTIGRHGGGAVDLEENPKETRAANLLVNPEIHLEEVEITGQ